MYDYDFFVIGAGSGGVRAARVAASLGASVAVAEERYFGGTCVNVGCVPKKLFAYAAHYADDFADSRGFGWDLPQPRFDWNVLRDNKDKEINRLNEIYRNILQSNDIDVFEARARISGANTVSIAGKSVSARYILLAVGGWPFRPQVPGNEFMWDSNDVFHLPSLPASMAILGGGYIALEFASIFSRLGVDTTLMYRGDKLLRGFDEELRDFVTAEIARHVNVKLNTEIVSVSSEKANGNSELTAVLNSGESLNLGGILAATGRQPLTGDLGLESVQVELSPSGGIVVDQGYQTSSPGIFAVGDVIERQQLTPVALAEGQWLAQRLFGPESDWAEETGKQPLSATFSGKAIEGGVRYDNIATAVFCHPNVATVGLSEQQAVAEYGDVDIYSDSMRILKHTVSGSEERSFIKLVVDAASQRVLGLHVLAPDAGELVQGFAVAMNCGATKVDFDRTIGIHPTLAEEFVTMRSSRKGQA